MYNAGRSGIATYGNTPNMQIQHNDISRFGFIASDLAGVYTALGKDDGSVVAYNRVHDAVGTPVGLYLDNSTSGYTIHNNLVNNVAYGITVNMNSTANDPPNNDSVYSILFRTSPRRCQVGGPPGTR